MDGITKTCADCGETLPLSEFPAWKVGATGKVVHSARCPPCHRARKAAQMRGSRTHPLPKHDVDRPRTPDEWICLASEFLARAVERLTVPVAIEHVNDARQHLEFALEALRRPEPATKPEQEAVDEQPKPKSYRHKKYVDVSVSNWTPGERAGAGGVQPDSGVDRGGVHRGADGDRAGVSGETGVG